MAPAAPEPTEWDLPRLRVSFGFEVGETPAGGARVVYTVLIHLLVY